MTIDRPYWNAEMETISASELERLEVEGLRKQLEYVYATSSFYRAKFDEAKIHPNDLQRHTELARFPFTTKEELRITQEEIRPLGGHQCAAMSEIVRIQGTSGTTGRSLYIGLTRSDINQWNELYARHAWTGGLRPDDVMINPASFTLFVGGLSESSGAEHMGITVIPAPFASTGQEKFMQLVDQFRPTVLFATPSSCAFLEQSVRKHLGVEPNQLGFKKGFLAGEALSEDERERIERVWGITARNFYGLADVAADIAAECGQAPGMHFCAQGALVAELIDPETTEPIPLREGAIGEIVFTTINRQATPVIRYRVRDIVQVFTDPCPCGRTGFRFVVRGRSDNMIKVKGVNVFPAAVKGIIQRFAPKTSGEMRIVLPHKGPAFGENLVIKVERGAALQDEETKSLGEEIRQTIRGQLAFTPIIEWVRFESLERTQYKVEYFERSYTA